MLFFTMLNSSSKSNEGITHKKALDTTKMHLNKQSNL